MTVRDVLDIHAYWRQYPPLVEIVAQACGVERRRRPQEEKPQQQLDQLRADIARLNGGR
jgi:hypothetical protein